jgi:AraC-like DNA-binding protein
MENKAIHCKYLMANEQDPAWGLVVNSVGYQRIKRDENYPPVNHPIRYLFSVEKGRILDEYQLVYITRGAGYFISNGQRKVKVGEGVIFLLFPNEWHSYYPDKKIGWEEYWIGFNGTTIDSLLNNGFFSQQKALFNIGIQEDLVNIYQRAIEVAQKQPSGFQQLLAGFVNYILGMTYSHNRQQSFVESEVVAQINRAKLIIIENYKHEITPEEIAEKINMGYSKFRKVFKEYTGFAPAQYVLNIRLQKSKELLTNTNLTAQEISFMVGFENSDYFNTIFRKKVGIPPIRYRNFTQGKFVDKKSD